MTVRSPRVPDLLAERAESAADGVAFLDDSGARLTFGAWWQRSHRVASGLAGLGVTVGDRIGLRFPGSNWAEFAIGYIGVLAAGAVAVPISPRATPAEAGAVLVAAGCTGLIHGGDLPAVPTAAWQRSVADLELPLAGATSPDAGDRPAGEGGGASSDLAQILQTSGTAGEPKLVAASHENVLAGWTPGSAPEHASGQVFVHATPIATNAGMATLLSPLREPYTSVVLAEFESRRYCDLVARHRASHTLLVPATARWLVDSPALATADLSTVQTVVMTSAAASPDLLARVARAFPTATLTNIYTTTEAWPAMTAMDYDPARPSSVGRPEPGQRLRIVGESDDERPPGQTGEIALFAGVATRTYLDGASDADTFADGWVRTGDLGYVDADGYLYLVGRRSEIVNTGGFLVAPAEVEAVLEEHPAVSEAGVTGLPHPVLGQVVGAAVVARSPVTVAELAQWARDRLADQKWPARIVLVDQLPRNALQKVARPALQALLEKTPDGSGRPPRTDDERVLLRLWCEVLRRDDIGVEDEFLAVGGHSLAAFEIAARAGQELGVEVPRELILGTGTVAAQAEAVSTLRSAPAGAGSVATTPIRRRQSPSGSDDVRMWPL